MGEWGFSFLSSIDFLISIEEIDPKSIQNHTVHPGTSFYDSMIDSSFYIIDRSWVHGVHLDQYGDNGYILYL